MLGCQWRVPTFVPACWLIFQQGQSIYGPGQPVIYLGHTQQAQAQILSAILSRSFPPSPNSWMSKANANAEKALNRSENGPTTENVDMADFLRLRQRFPVGDFRCTELNQTRRRSKRCSDPTIRFHFSSPVHGGSVASR